MSKHTFNQSVRPILIYDGECDFCQYWAAYWQKLTGDAVDYQPYQAVADLYPQITQEDFRQAVQYVSPDGKIARAAEASFLTLSHAPGKKFWWWLYRKLPGFAFIAEVLYAFIAAHRGAFYWWTLRLWGRNYEPPQFKLISWLILRAVGIIFFIAFFSFTVQALGLIGSQGVLPVEQFMQMVSKQLSSERYWLLPMIFWLNASDWFIKLMCWSGLLLSLCVVFNVIPRLSLLMLYFLYLSLMYAGQVFMSFQWDLLIIEVSLIAYFLVGLTTLGIWLLRWLVFRFMFASGLVKIMSGDPTWQDFTALYYHFYTQPLPTPIAWYVDQMPQMVLRLMTASVLFIELFVPFLIFFPRYIRCTAALLILLLQIVIILTGNYNFFNITVFAICLALFDDALIKKMIPDRVINFILATIKQNYPTKIFAISGGVFAVVTVYISIIQFHQRFYGEVPTYLTWLPEKLVPLQIVNTYGPFAVMTTRRMEIIIEGSNDGINWEEYIFKYKPGDVDRPPLWNIPFQPRLDWQMWFAALTPPERNHWFVNLMVRLLEGSASVSALFEKNPFPYAPPYYVRALFYEYHFTDFKEKRETNAWWKRELVGVYFPQAHLNK